MIPVGARMLAYGEISFYNLFYPHLNSKLTPYFLDERDHFFTGENLQDRKKYKIRYKSETNFSQTTDQTYLCVFISRFHLWSLEHVCKLSHSVDNINQPFYFPTRDPNDEVESREMQNERKQTLVDRQMRKKLCMQKNIKKETNKESEEKNLPQDLPGSKL